MNIEASAHFLFITDMHLSLKTSPFKRNDLKAKVPAIVHETREELAKQLLEKIAEDLRRNDILLSGVIFAGDAQLQGLAGGHDQVFELIMSNFSDRGISPSNIVATPGNHDVVKGSPPTSPERYLPFSEVWRKNGCVVPWLDGIDDPLTQDTDKFRLVGPDAQWVFFPVNTSNWSQVRAHVPQDLTTVWEGLAQAVSGADNVVEGKIRRALNGLLDYDMAHVSNDQLAVLSRTIADTPAAAKGTQIRLVVMHHHLRNPTIRFELKPFEGISNLEHLRSVLRENRIDALLHGHKHQHALRYEYLEAAPDQAPHRIAVLSGSTFEEGKEEDAARILTLSGFPFATDFSIEKIALPNSGLRLSKGEPENLPLWQRESARGGPITLSGLTIEDLYARATLVADTNPGETLIVHLDLPAGSIEAVNLPDNYPLPIGFNRSDMDRWLRELVTWWQLPRSRRDNDFPYPHGSRLRLFGGKLNQIKRITSLLKGKPTSRAMAVLVDPLRDFDVDGVREAFPSFTVLQVKKRAVSPLEIYVDVIGIYRAQEFSQWWPVNVAELRYLQVQIARAIKAKPGRITTITTDARSKPHAPGQVAVPIFDRWLDQDPAKLFLLGSALAGSSNRSEIYREVLKDWHLALDGLEAAVNGVDADGTPIPSEGLRTLTEYIALVLPAGSASPLYQTFDSLVIANDRYEDSEREDEDFTKWAIAVRPLINELRKIGVA